MIALLPIAAGIVIGAKIVSFICDELSEAEREKQERMRREYEQYEQNVNHEVDNIRYLKQCALNEIDEERKNSFHILEKQYYEKALQERRRLIGFYSEAVAERIEERKQLLSEIKETLSTVYEAKKKQNTMLRMNALEQLTRELEEAREKVVGYIEYLKKYQRNLQYCCNPESTAPHPFSMLLPEKFLYSGKVVLWKKADIQTIGSIAVDNGITLKYSFNENDFLEDYEDDAIIPLMAGRFDIGTFSIPLSAEKGVFKSVAINNPRTGIRATVERYNDFGAIELCYGKRVKMYLKKKNLVNPKRTPPIGASMRVFPIKWDYQLSEKRIVEVSERMEDSLISMEFHELPIVFTAENWIEFSGYLEKNNLFDTQDEWKIGPLREDEVPNVTKVKFQLGNELIFSAALAANNGKSYFEYMGLLEPSQSFKSEDIFVSIDATLAVVLVDEMPKLDLSIYENMNDLVIMAFHEFKLQYQTKTSQQGMQYFNKWAEVNDRLITYLYKGKGIECKFHDIIEEERYDRKTDGKVYTIYFSEPDEVKAYIEKVSADIKTFKYAEFFIEINKGEYIPVEFSPDCSYARAYGSRAPELIALNRNADDNKYVNIYNKSFCYAEIQQNSALQTFRIGRLANAVLQQAALDGKNIQACKEEIGEINFVNQNLPMDISQKVAVENALSEKNIYLIQGPPGTGKTTVIREIILQYISTHPASNILVVSQANVAVDNVLKGLLTELPNTLIRCGQADKIDDRIMDISFERKYDNYLQKMKLKTRENCNSAILDKWMEIVNPDRGYNPDIGELIMKRHRIIGATCVGLAKKRIGLDRLIFDLVIIDEAGKALPAEVLIPYIKARKVILIGDHKQLPPTINTALFDESKIELDDRDLIEDELFERSLFDKLFVSAPESNKCMLKTQYRMPATLGNLISNLFYENEIRNGEGTFDKQPLYFKKNINLIDMSKVKDYCEDSSNKVSVINHKEAEYVCSLILNIKDKVKDAQIAVITPYKGQKRLIIRTMLNWGYDPRKINVTVNTVDAFQGDEAEIVIYCTTRANKPTKYFSDYKRINVAFSRAKNELIIIGSLSYFYKYRSNNSVLPKVADFIKEHGEVINPNIIEPRNDRRLQEKYEVLSLETIKVPNDFLQTPPKRAKIDSAKEYFIINGEFDEYIMVRIENEEYVIADKYIRYIAAKELGLSEVKVKIV